MTTMDPNATASHFVEGIAQSRQVFGVSELEGFLLRPERPIDSKLSGRHVG